jgi:hypothetical protein
MTTRELTITTLTDEIELLTHDALDTLSRCDALIRIVTRFHATKDAFTLASQLEDAKRYADSSRMYAIRLGDQIAELQQERDKEPHS